MRIEPVPPGAPHPEFELARSRFGWLPNTIRGRARGTNAAGMDERMLIDIAAIIAENTLGDLVDNLAQTEIAPILRRPQRKVMTP